MNQRQRAGKHPSFVRDRKPLGMKREKFTKKFNDVNLNQKSRETRQERKDRRSKSVGFIQTEQRQLLWSSRKDASDNPGKKRRFVEHSFTGRTKVAASSTIIIDNPTERSWMNMFDVVSHCKKYSPCFLRYFRRGDEAASPSEDNAVPEPAILPEALDMKHVLDSLYAKSSVSAECFILEVKTAFQKGGRPVKRCLRESLQHKHWPLLHRLMTLFTPSTRDADAVLKAALLHEQWSLVQLSVERCSVSSHTLQLALAEALAFKNWATIKACIERGTSIAAACTKKGFDLNAKTGTAHTTLLQAAVASGSAENVELILRAGADPDIYWETSETVIHQAVRDQRWDLVGILLQHSKKAGEIVSRRSACKGTTLLHVLCEQGQADLVHTLLLMKADPLATDADDNTLMMAAMGASQGRENLIRVLIQAGAATHQGLVSRARLLSLRDTHQQNPLNGQLQHFPSPMWQAVTGGHLRLAKMLYASGACSHKEIHELSTYLANRDASNAYLATRGDNFRASPTTVDSCHAFVEDISSRPRSLRDACVLRVSHLIGCGPEREDRAAAISLPVPLRRLVLQDHVVSPDFLNDCCPDPQRSSAFYFENLFGSLDTYVSYFGIY